MTGLAHHWNNDGGWSVYEYEDRYRGCHKKSETEVSYFEFYADVIGIKTLENVAETCDKVYSKPRDWNSCIRCGTHKDLDTRPDLSNAMFCDRCYAAAKTFSGSGVEYEILDCGLKGKVIKDASETQI